MTTYEIRVAEGNEPAFDVDVVRGEVGVNGYVNMLLDVLGGQHEVKTDYRAGETGNFYIEATSYDEQGEYDSGITVTKSTWWVQAAPNGQGFIIIKTDALKEIIRDTYPKEVKQPIYNSGTKASTGFLVKVADVVKKLFPSP